MLTDKTKIEWLELEVKRLREELATATKAANIAIDVVRRAPVERQAPEGFAIVPLEPTQEMREAGAEWCEGTDETSAALCYRAMIAAAPSAQGRTEG